MNPHQLMGAVSTEAHQPVGTQVPEAMPRRLAHPYPADAAPPVPTSLATPTPQPSPVPTPLPVTVGPRILMYGQHPPVREPGVRAVFMPRVVLNGPADARIVTELPGTTPVARNAQGDFLFLPGTPEFDCVHTFAVVRDTLTMYERLGGGEPLPFAWNTGGNTDRLTVHPHAATGANACYSRTAKALKFMVFTPAGSTTEIFTCRSADIVAHETGHAILDGLKPSWLGADNPPQTGGLHEAFGDLTAIFLALGRPDQAEALVAATKADLHARSFLPWVAADSAALPGLRFGLGNACNDLKLSQVGNAVHAIGQVFTGGVYDVLADIYAFERGRHGKRKDATLLLMEVAGGLCGLLFDAVTAAPDSGATYTDVVNRMLQLSAGRGDPAIHRTFIRNRFAFREVVASPTPLGDLLSGRMNMSNAGYTGDGKTKDAAIVKIADESSASLCAVQDRSSCCGTLQLPEFQVVDRARLARRGSLYDDDILAAELAELGRAFSKGV